MAERIAQMAETSLKHDEAQAQFDSREYAQVTRDGACLAVAKTPSKVTRWCFNSLPHRSAIFDSKFFSEGSIVDRVAK